MRFKNLFFDLDDTLWAFSENARDTFSEVYTGFRLDRYFNSFEHFYTLYKEKNAELWKLYQAGEIEKKDLNRTRFYYPLEAVGVTDEKLAESYSAYFFDHISLKTKLMPDAEEVLEYLKGRGYRMFVLSNGFRNLQYQKMESSGLGRYFGKVVLSDDLGVLKPNPALFRFALSATQSDLRDSLMVGDSWDADVVGARDAGMAQVYFNHVGRTDLPFRPTYEINRLAQLEDFL